MQKTWHLMFDRLGYQSSQINDLMKAFVNEGYFNGFPLIAAQVKASTNSLIYADIIFDQTVSDFDLNLQSLQRMVKYIYARLVIPHAMNTPRYYQIIARSLDELGIEMTRYPNGNDDVIFWSKDNVF